jgi:hypothetical protein
VKFLTEIMSTAAEYAETLILVTFGFSPNIPLQESLVAYKIPSFASAKASARATPSRTFDLIRKIFTHVFFLNLPCHVPLRTVSFEWNKFITWCQGSSYSTKPCGWCAVSSPCGKFEHTLPTPLRDEFGPNAKARDAIHVDFSEAFPLPEGIGESLCRPWTTRITPLGNTPPPPPRLRPQPPSRLTSRSRENRASSGVKSHI